MKNLSFKALLPYLVAIPVILIVAAIYFRPEVFEGKVLQQSDVMQFEGMSRMSQEYGKKYGQSPLWNVAMFSGFPEYLIASVPDGVLHYLFRLTTGFFQIGSSMQLFFVLAACAWGMMLCFRVNPYLAIVGGIATAFSTFYIISLEVGHVTKLWAIAYSAMVIGGLHLFYTGKKWLGLALFTLFFALQMRANHYQITFYLFFVCLSYVISELIFAYREKKLVVFLKHSSLLLVAILLAVATQLGRLWMTYEYTPYSIRGKSELTPKSGKQTSDGLDKDYAFSWSQGKLETFTLLIPYFYGGSSHEKLREDSHSFQAFAQVISKDELMRYMKNDAISLPLYYGDQPFTAGPLYAGAVICFLFVLALFLLPDRLRWWILAASVLCMLFAWGRNLAWFNYFLFDYVPGFNKFRSVSMALSMTLLLMPLGAMLALQHCLAQLWDKSFQQKFLWAFSLTGGIALLMWLLANFFDYQHPNDASTIAAMFGSQEKALISLFKNAFEDDRKMLLQKDALRSLAFIAFVAGLLWAMLTKKISASYALTGIAVLAIIDLWVVDKRYLNDANFIKKTEKATFTASEADKEILKDTTLHYRVMNLQNTFQEARTSYFHKSIGGYFAAKMRRYQDLIENQLLIEQQRLIANLQAKKENFAENLPALCMLNARYFKLGESKQEVLLNSSALGNAWFVDSLRLVATADDEIASIDAIRPAQTAVLNQQKFSVKATSFQRDSSAWVKLIDFQPRKLVYEYKNDFNGFLVFSEVYYPHGWKAFIDGNEVRILNVNYVLRGLEVPPGKHQITFTFNPISFEIGSRISTYASFILLLFLLGAIFFELKPTKTTS